MAEERLEIILEADVKQATAAIDGFSNSLSKKLPAASAKAAAGLNSLNKAAVNANPALQNFGRVIQDAPFGILGIANNIDPLVESFQRLKTQSGSTSGALKALLAGLTGPAGIAIGISAVTSALIAFGPAISDAISGITAYEKALNEAGAAGSEAFKKAQIEFALLTQNANNSTISINQQEDAFNKANTALGSYGIEIESLSAFQKQGAVIGDIYAKIKQNEAKANALAAASAAQYAAGIAAVNFAQEQGTKLVTGGFFEKLLFFANPQNIAALSGAVNQIDNQAKAQNTLDNAVSAVNRENQKLIGDLEKLDGIAKKGTAKELAKAEIERAKALKTQSIAIKENNIEEVFANTNRKAAILLVNQETAGLLALSAAADKAFLAKQKTDNLDKQKLLGGATNVSGIKAPGAVNIDPEKLNILQGKVGLFAETILALKDNLEGIAELGIGGAIDSVFTAIQNGDNVFKALGDSVKGFVIELVKAVAKALILQAIMTALFPQGAAATAAAGGGGIFKAIGSLFGSKAAGGPVVAGGGYIVGENGPEKFYPSQPGMIVPNGGGGGGNLTARISGNSLLFLLNQASQSSRMNFG
jgi:hypothetical protein